MTLAELKGWTLTANWGVRRKQQLKSHLRRYVVQHSSAQICQLWAEVTNDARRSGRSIEFC
ncbi:MAG: hypothetical protein WKF30_01065 [Pyrinomonadaceae bacterium]